MKTKKKIISISTVLLLASSGAFAIGDSSMAASEGLQAMDQAQKEARAENANGLTSEQITMVQKALSEKGFYKKSQDGIFGPFTNDAVRKFQRTEGISAKGELNQETLDALGVNINLKQAQEEHTDE